MLEAESVVDDTVLTAARPVRLRPVLSGDACIRIIHDASARSNQMCTCMLLYDPREVERSQIQLSNLEFDMLRLWNLSCVRTGSPACAGVVDQWNCKPVLDSAVT